MTTHRSHMTTQMTSGLAQECAHQPTLTLMLIQKPTVRPRLEPYWAVQRAMK